MFISYAYDSARHKQQVHEFAWFLRAEGGIDVRFDLWNANRRQDWSVWIIEQVREADFVLVAASPAYKRRAEGNADPSEGRGVQFEAAFDELYRVITGQPRHRPPSLGRLVVLPRRAESSDERGEGLPVES